MSLGDGAAGSHDIAMVGRRIKAVVRTLDNFKSLRAGGRTRADYVDQVSDRSVAIG